MNRRIYLSSCILILLVIVLSAPVSAAEVEFDVVKQEVEINIYEDWSVLIWYFITIETTQGPHNGIYLGIPDDNISDYGASVGNTMLNVEQTTYEGGDVLKIYFPETKYAGDFTELKVSFWAYDRLFPDQTDDNYMGMYFIPATWQNKVISRQSITYVLPEGVEVEDVKFVPNPQSMYVTDRVNVYFELLNSTPESFNTNVLFPKLYLVPEDEKRENPAREGGLGISSLFLFLITGIIIIIVAIIIIAYLASGFGKKKKKYTKPELAMESLGVRKDLDNVEASVILNADPIKVINLIILGLVKKGLAEVESWGPLTMVMRKEEMDEKALKCPNCGAPLKIGLDVQECDYCGSEVRITGRPTYYENQFLLHALKKNGRLDEKGIRIVLSNLSKRVNEKMRGYNRKDSIKFYDDKVKSSWGEISKASDEERYRLFGEDIGWLMLDDKYEKKVDDSFKDVSAGWTPSSWWVWYNLGRATTMSGDQFSEKAKSTNVTTEKRFGVKSSKLKGALATPVKVAHSHKSGCACACVNCACACACVSCACACAGGGGF